MQARVYQQVGGRFNPTVGFNEYETNDMAIAAWWAAAKCECPYRAALFCGMDGWLTNDHLNDKEVPARLADLVAQCIEDENNMARYYAPRFTSGEGWQ